MVQENLTLSNSHQHIPFTPNPSLMMTKADQLREFYDNYVERQVKVGINDRHKSIDRWVKKFGVKRESNVLEVGCGIGTQTQLLAEYIQSPGKILANDISERSIEVAKKQLQKFSHITFVAEDITTYEVDEKFDLILMPDVIEHIPLELHFDLFAKLSDLLAEDGMILIHIPEPTYHTWCLEHRPEAMQVIDQPIYTDNLISNLLPHGLHIKYLESYPIWWKPYDYQIIKVVKVSDQPHFIEERVKKPSLLKTFMAKAKFKLSLMLRQSKG